MKFDIFGELGGNVNIVETEVDMSWHHDEIVISVGYASFVIAKDFLCSKSVYAKLNVM